METGLKIKIGADASGVAETFVKVSQSAKKTIDSFAQIPRASGAATQSLTNLSRIAQDLPYGFIGIANNLNPMLESFQRLKAETGTTGSALKALTGSLTGAGGLGLALGIASSLLVTFGDKLFGSKEATEDQNDALKKLNETLDESQEKFNSFVGSIEQLNRLATINIKIAGLPQVLDLQGQKVSKDFEIFAAQEREKELQRIYSESLSQSKDVQDRALKELRDHQNKLQSLRQEGVIIERSIALQRKEDADDALKEQRAINEKELAEAKEHADKLRKIYEQRKLEIRRFLKSLPESGGIEGLKQYLIEQARDEQKFAALQRLYGNGPQTKGVTFRENFKGQIISEEEYERLIGVQNLIASGLTPAFEEMFGAIAHGGNAFQALGDAIGKTIKQLIAQLAAMAAVSGILSLLGGGSFNKIFSKVFKSNFGFTPFAEGGLAYGPTVGLVGEYAGARNNPEVIAPLSKLKDMLGNYGMSDINVTGQLEGRGDSLIAIVERTRRRQNRNF
jgi:hypothetical protein